MSTETTTLLDTIVVHAYQNNGYLSIGCGGSSGWVVEYGYGDPWTPASRKDERVGWAFNTLDLGDALMRVVGELQDVALCFHCGQRVARAEGVWMHLTGRNHGCRSCCPQDSFRPYGLLATPGLSECQPGCPCLSAPPPRLVSWHSLVGTWALYRRRRLFGPWAVVTRRRLLGFFRRG